jgi:ABC-2 type transport system permease protein
MAQALALGALIGTAVAAGLGSLGLLISVVSNSNKTSLAASLLLLIALFAPTQLPSGLPQGWFSEVLLRLNPVASGLTTSPHRWSVAVRGLLICPISSPRCCR